MTSESDFWGVVRRHLTPYGRLQRIESHMTALGIPDVAYCLLGSAGWLELKHESEWPRRATTALSIRHLKLEQVLFLEDWTRHPARGSAYGLIQVDRDYLLLDPSMVRRVFERSATREQLIQGARVHGSGTFPTIPLVRVLAPKIASLI